MNKKQLINKIFETGYFEYKYNAEAFLDEFLTIISDTVASGNEVRITDFGKIEPFKLASGKTVPKFRVFKGFADKVA